MGIVEQVKQIRLEEAREEARIKKETEVVERLLAKEYSAKEIAAIAGVSVAFVEKVKKTMQ